MKTRGRAGRRVAASKLAQMGVCEIQVVLGAKYGDLAPRPQRQARARGIAEHLKMDRAARQFHNTRGHQSQPSPCFIATQVYGLTDPRTDELRTFRDQVLMRSSCGRVAVRVYYRLSPGIARWLSSRPGIARWVRLALDQVRRVIRTVKAGAP